MREFAEGDANLSVQIRRRTGMDLTGEPVENSVCVCRSLLRPPSELGGKVGPPCRIRAGLRRGVENAIPVNTPPITHHT